jgi:hypothetical protein
MIPGLNTNVTHGGIEYHVQTEDLGRGNPYVLTLVFRAGAIIAREKVNYQEALGEAAPEGEIKRFMDQQHQRIIQGILADQPQAPAADKPAEPPPSQATPEPPKPSLPPADKSLDQLITEYLRSRNADKPR